MSNTWGKAVPNKLKVINGKRGEDYVEPEIEIPDPPETLPVEAQLVWMEIAAILVKAQMLTELDLPQLEVYCLSYIRWRNAEAELDDKGMLMSFTRDTGEIYEQVRPEVGLARTYYAQMKTAADALGLSPAARAKIAPGAGKKKTKMGDMLD